MSTHLSPLKYHHGVEESFPRYLLGFLDDDESKEIIIKQDATAASAPTEVPPRFAISANTGFATLIEFEGKQYSVYFECATLNHSNHTRSYEYYLAPHNSNNTQVIDLLKEKIKSSATSEVEIKVIVPFDKTKYSDFSVIPSMFEVQKMIQVELNSTVLNDSYFGPQQLIEVAKSSETADHVLYNFVISNLRSNDDIGNFTINQLQLGDFRFNFDFRFVKNLTPQQRDVQSLVYSWNADLQTLVDQIVVKQIGATDLYVMVKVRRQPELPTLFVKTYGELKHYDTVLPDNLPASLNHVFNSNLGIFRHAVVKVNCNSTVTNASDVYSKIYNQRTTGDSLSSAIKLAVQPSIDSLNVTELNGKNNAWYFYTFQNTSDVISYIYSSKLFEPTNIRDTQFGHLMLRVDVPKTASSNRTVEFYYGYAAGQSFTDIHWVRFLTESSKINATQIQQTDDLQFISKEDKKRWDASIQTASTWLNPVQSASDLPSSASNGSRCVVLSNNEIYRYYAGAWTIDNAEISRGTDIESNVSNSAQALTNISQAKLWQLNRGGFGYKLYEQGAALIPSYASVSKYQESANNPYNQNWFDLVQRFNYGDTTWPAKFEPKEGSINLGINNTVAGANSVIYGSYISNQNPNDQTILVGNNLTRTSEAVIVGKFNKSNPDAIVSIGVGTDNNNRKNAVEILSNGALSISGVFASTEIPANAVLTNSGYLDFASVAKTEELSKYVKKSAAIVFRHVPLDFTGTEAEEKQLPEIAIYKEN